MTEAGPEEHSAYAVVGGGIAGLAAAHELSRRGAPVVLFEASERLGGKIRTTELEGVRVEEGPDSFVARDRAAAELCEELGLGDELVEPAEFGAYVWLGDRLRRIPPGFVLGLPASPLGLVRSRILSPQGSLRALGDLVIPGRLRGPDVSVGSFVTRRFGAEVLERLVDPILAGTRAGRVTDISLAAAAPQIDAVARSHRSVLLGLARNQGSTDGTVPPFLGLRSGMQSFVERLERHLTGAVEIHTGTAVEAIASDMGGYRIQHAAGETSVRGVVIATPAFAAAGIIAGLSPEAAAELHGIRYSSVAIANLVYPPGAGRLPRHGSGILVPSSQGRTLAGCTWTSRKWPHLAPPDGGLSIRCFVGRGDHEAALDLDDANLVQVVHGELAAALGLTESPRAWRVTRWERAIPQYAVGHRERMEVIETALLGWPAVALAGAAYRGSGITDCIVQGRDAAGRVLEDRRHV